MATFDANYYQNAIDDYNKKVASDLAQQTQQAEATRQSNLQQSYIQRMQNQNALNNNLAQQGIRGGMSETANLNLMNTYNANRNTINSDYATQVTNLQTNANDNKFNYEQQMKTAQAEYLQNKQAEEQQLMNDYYNSRFAKYYSIKELKALHGKATTTAEKTAINNRIAYLRAHKKGY